MSWAIIGASVVGAGAGIYGSQLAANASKEGSKNALGLQQQQYGNALQMLEPQRGLGYGALSDLASLYGYALPAYTPLNQLGAAGTSVNLGKNATVGGPASFGGPISVSGRQNDTDYLNPAGVFGLGGNDNRAFGGTIDPITGTVTLKNIRNPKKEAKREAAATAFLRGETDKLGGDKMRRIRETIDRMRDAGYQYDPNAAAAPAAAPTAGPTGQPGNMSRFFTSPDYQFRLSEGLKALDQSAAARGGALSGNAIRANNEYGSNLAAGEYGNYVNRLMAMAGLGQTATTQSVGAGQSYANNAGGLQQNIGDARASGIMGATNSAVNALGNGMNLYMLQRYMNQGPPVAPRSGYTPAPGMGIMPLPPGY